MPGLQLEFGLSSEFIYIRWYSTAVIGVQKRTLVFDKIQLGFCNDKVCIEFTGSLTKFISVRENSEHRDSVEIFNKRERV